MAVAGQEVSEHADEPHKTYARPEEAINQTGAASFIDG